MNTPSRTDHDPANDSSTPAHGYGWGQRTDRRARRSAPADGGIGTASARQTGTARGTGEDDFVPVDRHADAADDRRARADARADAGVPGGTERADAVPLHHEIAVPDADGTGGLVMTSRAGRVAQQGVDGLRFVNEPLGSLRQILWAARYGDFNLAHIPAIRSANIAFYYLVTAPNLIVARFHEWVHLRLHRAVTAWAIVLVCAHFLNRLLGWPVLAWFDPWAWSATTWQFVAGGAFVFVLATVVVYLRGPE